MTRLRLRVNALAAASFVGAGAAHALPLSPSPADFDRPFTVEVQDLCGAIGNCGIGRGGVNTIPRHTITPDIGRFDPGHDERFGRYRYEPPDQQLNLRVQRMQGGARTRTPRHTGTRTIYRVEKLSAEHVDWCYAKYKSYRAKDNTYQPANGSRKTCVSPFS